MSGKRVPVIAGNWKMNLTRSQALELLEGIRVRLPKQPPEAEIIVAPSYTSLETVSRYLKQTYIRLAAQDVCHVESGAFTGACSGLQVWEAGAEYVIIGHSERRQYFGDTDLLVLQKVRVALDNRLIPIVCVGESSAERESGQVAAIIQRQLGNGLAGIDRVDVSRMIIAYEPVWAIGTGKTATPQQVEEVHQLIRASLATAFGDDVSQNVRILYGGSVKASNARKLLALPNVDGALVGGASLKADEFVAIIQSLP